MRFRRTTMVAASLALLGTGLLPALATTAAAATGDVTSFLNGGAHGNFNAAETQITPSTAGQLALQWSAQSVGGGYIATQPVVGNGIVYWGDSNGWEHATNATTGAEVWRLFVGASGLLDSNPDICGPTTLGANAAATLATVNGRQLLFVNGGGNTGGPGTLHMYAVDPATGTVVWETPVGNGPTPAAHSDTYPGYDVLWAAPQVFNNNVYIATAGHGDCPHWTISKVIKLSGATGTVLNTLQISAPNCMGADIWGSPTIDAANGMMYVATSEADTSTPGCSTEQYADAILKIDTSTMTVADYDGVPLNASLDYDFGSTPVLFSGTVGGVANTPLVGVVNKNGTYYVWRRANLAAHPVWSVTIADPGLASPQAGDGSIAPAGWDGASLYVAGGNGVAPCAGSPGTVRSLDPGTATAHWVRCLDGSVLGAPAGAPGILAVGAGNHVEVLSSATGGELWRYTDGSGAPFWSAPTIANGWLYAANADGNLYAFTVPTAPPTGAHWSGWLAAGGPPPGAAQAPSVASWASGRLDLFVKGNDGALWHSWQVPGGGFSGWENLGGQLTSGPSAVSWGPNRIDVFAQGTDHGLWHKWWDGHAWSRWEPLGGVLGTNSAPAAASWSAGRLDVVVKGSDNAIWHKWWDGSAWHGFESLGGACQDDPGAASWGPGVLDVFCLSANTPLLWHRAYRGAWSGWLQEVPGTWANGISVAHWAPNRLDVFGTDAGTSALRHAWWDGSAWHVEVLDGVLASTPTAVSWAFNRIDVFVLGIDHQLWHKIWG